MKRKVRRGVGLVLLSYLLLTLGLDRAHTPVNLNKPAEITARHATMKEKNENRKIAKQYAWVAFGWRGEQWRCLEALWTRESRFDHKADNPKSTAYGIAQLLGERSPDPRVQILRGLRYIEHRYGTPCRAWNYWNQSRSPHY